MGRPPKDDLTRHWILCRDYLRVALVSIAVAVIVGGIYSTVLNIVLGPFSIWQLVLIPASWALAVWFVVTVPWVVGFGVRDRGRRRR